MKKTPRICKRWWTGCGGDEFAAGYVFSAGLICHGMKKRNTKLHLVFRKLELIAGFVRSG